LRSLRAELENWNYDAPTEWNPGPDDILVGEVKEYSSHDWNQGVVETLTVQEEETGSLVLVRLDSEQLANLIKLQRPRVGDRIGLKNVGMQSGSGDNHYVLMVDRQPAAGSDSPEAQTSRSQQNVEVTEEDEDTAATLEERLFIEQELDKTPTPTIQDASSLPGTESALREIINRQDQEIRRQAEMLDKLESMLATSIQYLGEKAPSSTEFDLSDNPTESKPPKPETITFDQKQPRPRKWGKYLLAALALAASCGLGIAAHIIFRIP
jgi:hypothetical protein